MLKSFKCLDGEQRLVSDCLGKPCPCGDNRCLSLPTLIAVSRQRTWTGKPSTTQCINGIRHEFLKLTHDFAIDPKSKAFALLGSQHHDRLAIVAQRIEALAEEQVGDDEDVSGILDLLTLDEHSPVESYILWDYKTSGSFKIAKALGLVGKKEPNPSGEVYKSSGKWGKAGDVKMITVYTQDPTQIDMRDWELQLNKYRLDIEHIGFPVSRMYIQATIRDGGTFIAENRGLPETIYLIPVRRIADAEVSDYFRIKANALVHAMTTGELPPPCSKEECWDSVRCARFCEVWQHCDVGSAIHANMKEDAK